MELLTVADVGRIADRTPETIRKAIAAGRIKVAQRTRSGVRLVELAEAERFAATLRSARPKRGESANGALRPSF